MQRLLFGLTFITVTAAGSVASWGVYESLQTAPVAPAATASPDIAPDIAPAPIDLRALARDPGPVYDRRPVTPSPSPTSTPPPAAAPSGGFVRTPSAPQGREPYRMVIDSIGVDAPVVPAYTDANGVPQVPYNGYDVAWYVSTAAPGTGDNAVFAAHVTWNGVAVFYNLHLLAVGAQIRLAGDDGTTLLYTVTDSFLVDQDDPNSIQVMRSTGYDAITLISCDGAFFPNGSFGDYTSRRVIRGSLTEKVLAPGAQPASGP